jgi:nitrite reductase/ring-hydroxylating ferredoxin subunit
MTNKQNHIEAKDVTSPRRKFLYKLWVGLGVVAFAELIWMVLSFLKPIKNQQEKGEFGTLMKAGSVESFLPNSVTAFPRGHFYLSCLADGGFLAIHRQCTHLGCTFPWIEKEKQFVCPCHSSAFDIRGGVIRSPAPRALDIFPVIIENNVVFVDTGQRIKRSGFKPENVVYPKKRA